MPRTASRSTTGVTTSTNSPNVGKPRVSMKWWSRSASEPATAGTGTSEATNHVVASQRQRGCIANAVSYPVRHCAHFFIGLVGSLALSATLLATAVGARQQLESSVACNEATEPLRMVYGQYATGCAIDQPTDLDRFVVAAGAGDTLRTTL